MLYKISILLLLLSGSSARRNAVVNFDISPDDSSILVAYYSLRDKSSNSFEGSSIYKFNIDGSNPEVIIKTDNKRSFYGPRFSSDGEKIVFVEYLKADYFNRSIYISDSDGKNIERLTNGGEIIDCAFFSNNKEEIIYTKARHLEYISPIEKARPYGFDLYSINIKTRKVIKLTDLNLYGMYDVSEMYDNKYLFHRSSEQGSGLSIVSLEHPKIIENIIPSNKSKEESIVYFDPSYSKENNMIAFGGTCELYIMDLKTKKARLLLNNQQTDIRYIRFSNCHKRIFFHNTRYPYLCSINIDGSDMRKIPIMSNISEL